MRENKGITLVALIITIIILIILAAVTINSLTHDGLINMAIRGAEEYKAAEQKELSEMNKMADNLNSIISGNEGGEGPVIITGVIEFGALIWENNKASVTVNKTTNDNLQIEYQVLNKDNQVISDYQTIANGEMVSNLNLGDFVIARLTDGQNHGNTATIEVTDKIAPTVSVTKGEVTTNSITVTVSATDAEWGMPANPNYSYFIKKSTDSNYPKTAIYIGEEITYKFIGLAQDTSYDIKVVAQDKAGNEGSDILAATKTSTVGGAGGSGSDETIGSTGNIEASGLTWAGGKASVTLSTNISGMSIQWQVGGIDGTWETGQSSVTINNLNHGDNVYARLFDGVNVGSEAYVAIRDGNKPAVSVARGGIGTSNITVTVSATDAEWGMPANPNYSYFIKKSTDSNYPSEARYTGPETTYTFSGLTQNTIYDIKVTAQDKAGNEGSDILADTKTSTVGGAGGSGSDETIGTTGNIRASGVTWAGGKASVTLSTNISGMSIQWQVGGTSGQWQTGQSSVTVNNLNHGDNVYARLFDGVNVGNAAYIAIRDTAAPSQPVIEVSSGTSGNNNWYRSNVVLTINQGSDGESGVNRTTYVVSGAQTAGETNGTSVTISAEGTSYITAYTYDNAGNKATSSTLTIKKDSVGPTINGLSNIKVTSSTTSLFTDGVTVSDGTSGVTSSTSYTYNPKTLSKGANTITYTATDNAGNTTTATRVITYEPDVCFVAGTKVSTPNGLKNIEELKIGELVYSYNEETKEIEEKEILNTFINEAETITTITFENGEQIQNTIAHPYYVIGKGWRETRDLSVGDMILTQDKKEVEIQKISTEKIETTKVYNFEIAENHNYFVGTSMLLVHNAASASGGCGLEEMPID